MLLEQVVAEYSSDTTYVFGHAKPGMPLTGTRADLLAFRDYFTGLLEYVQSGIAAGKSADEITQIDQLPGFSDYSGMPTGTVQMAYEELTVN